MHEEAGEDLFEGALPIAESEGVFRWDRFQLAVAELGDLTEGLARGRELLDHGAQIDGVCRVLVFVLGCAGPVFGLVCGSVAEGSEEPGDAMSCVLGGLVGG